MNTWSVLLVIIHAKFQVIPPLIFYLTVLIQMYRVIVKIDKIEIRGDSNLFF